MRKTVNVEPGKQGFQRTVPQAAAPPVIAHWRKPETESPFPTVSSSSALNAIYTAYLEGTRQNEVVPADVHKTHLSPFHPFTDDGEWPTQHLARSLTFNPDDTTPLTIYTDGSFRPRRNQDPASIHEGSTSWAWVDLDSLSWSAGANPKDTAATSCYLEAYAILDTITHTPPNRPLRILTDSQSSISIYQKIFSSPAYVPVTRTEHILAAAVALSRGRTIELDWVQGHAWEQGNHTADRLAAYIRAISSGKEPIDTELTANVIKKAMKRTSVEEKERRAEGKRRHFASLGQEQ